jgi:hypothetical protein
MRATGDAIRSSEHGGALFASHVADRRLSGQALANRDR